MVCHDVMFDQEDHESPLRFLTPLVMGGAGFSYQLRSNPHDAPVADIIKDALDQGIRAFDTSPYYEPSEDLMGIAFQDARIRSLYKRSDYMLMTKAGRIKEDLFDYSPAWINQSVHRSLKRFDTPYLDVVFCHDVEFVSREKAVRAVGELFKLVHKGIIRYVGISGYDLDILVHVAEEVHRRYSRPIDVVQNWAQLTLQNTRLEEYGFAALRAAGVRAVCCASPLACGLLRSEGVPVGALGNWHPAPAELRARAELASSYLANRGEQLSSVALRYALAKANLSCGKDFVVTTITGISSAKDLAENIETTKTVLHAHQPSGMTQIPLFLHESLNSDRFHQDQILSEAIRDILQPWVGYDFIKGPVKFESNTETPCAEDINGAIAVNNTTRLSQAA